MVSNRNSAALQLTQEQALDSRWQEDWREVSDDFKGFYEGIDGGPFESRLFLDPNKFELSGNARALGSKSGYSHLQYSVSPGSCKPFTPIVDMLVAYINRGWIKRLTVMVATCELHYVHFLYHPEVLSIIGSTEDETQQKRLDKAQVMAQDVDRQWWAENEAQIERLVGLCFAKGVGFDVQRWQGLWDLSRCSLRLPKMRMLHRRGGVMDLRVDDDNLLPGSASETLYERYLHFVETIFGRCGELNQAVLEELDGNYPELPNISRYFQKPNGRKYSRLEDLMVVEKEKSFRILLLAGLRSAGFFKNLSSSWSVSQEDSYRDGVIKVLKDQEDPDVIFDDDSRNCFDEACSLWSQQLGYEVDSDSANLLFRVRVWVMDILHHEETFLIREIAGRMAMMTFYAYESQEAVIDKYRVTEVYYGDYLNLMREWFGLLRNTETGPQPLFFDLIKNGVVVARPFSFSDWLNVLASSLRNPSKKKGKKTAQNLSQEVTESQIRLVTNARTYIRTLRCGSSLVEKEVDFEGLSTAQAMLKLHGSTVGSAKTTEESNSAMSSRGEGSCNSEKQSLRSDATLFYPSRGTEDEVFVDQGSRSRFWWDS